MRHLRFLSFIIFGILLQQLVHHIVEIWYIELLINDFNKYSLGLNWDGWFMVHHIGSFVLLGLGIWFGHWLGKSYVKSVFGNPLS